MTSRAVVSANDMQLFRAHREFCKWKKKNPVAGTLCATDFTFALKHFDKYRRAITKNCPSFQSRKTYARSMVTTYIIGKKTYWKARDDVGWKRAGLKPPPAPRNGAPMRVFFNHNRKSIYTSVKIVCVIVFMCLCVCDFSIPCMCMHTGSGTMSFVQPVVF